MTSRRTGDVAVTVAVPTQAQRLRDQAADAIASDPDRALERTRQALDLDPGTLEGRYLEAAALARLGRAAEAREALADATEREPSEYVTWVLLGDLYLRMGDVEAALNAYVEASALNPRDPQLAQLASSREAVEQFAWESGVAG